VVVRFLILAGLLLHRLTDRGGDLAVVIRDCRQRREDE
jgi:hypothetical protein